MFCPPEVILRPLARKAVNSLPKSIERLSQSHLYRTLASSATRHGTYKAAVIKELGKPLVIESFSRKATLSPNEVRVEIHAAGINFADLLLVQGTYQVKPKLPFTPGSEVSGVIVEVGENVKRVKPGSRILSISAGGMGGFGEEIVIKDHEAYEIPDTLSFTQAAALLCSYGTAITALEKRARIKKGELVLVTAAAGALGLATVDLATNVCGAKVIGAAGSNAKCDLIKSYGAFHTINYNESNIRDEVKKVVPKGVDVVIDQVGGDAFRQAFRSLAPEARFIVLGFASGDIPKVPANHLLVKNVTMAGLYWGGQAMYNYDAILWSAHECIKLFKNGKINPHVGATFSLENVNDAMQYILDRKSTGKVVLTMK